MLHEKENAPMPASPERVGLTTILNDSTFRCVLLYGLYILATVLAAVLVTLTWAVTT